MNLSLAIALPQIGAIIGLVVLLILLFIVGSFLSVWLKAFSSGAPVSMWNLIAMRYLRKLPYSVIVDARIMAVTEIDAAIEDIALDSVAELRRTQIEQAIKNY